MADPNKNLEFDDDREFDPDPTLPSCVIDNYDPWVHGVMSLCPDPNTNRKITIFPDGRVDLVGMEPDEAAKAFWDWIEPTATTAVRDWCVDVLSTLEAQIEAGDLDAARETIANAQSLVRPDAMDPVRATLPNV